MVDKVVDKRGTRKLAEAYLQYLYSEAGQEIAARHHLRPRSETVLAKYAKDFPEGQHVHRRRGLRRLGEGAEGRTSTTARPYDQVIAAAKARGARAGLM